MVSDSSVFPSFLFKHSTCFVFNRITNHQGNLMVSRHEVVTRGPRFESPQSVADPENNFVGCNDQ